VWGTRDEGVSGGYNKRGDGGSGAKEGLGCCRLPVPTVGADQGASAGVGRDWPGCLRLGFRHSLMSPEILHSAPYTRACLRAGVLCLVHVKGVVDCSQQRAGRREGELEATCRQWLHKCESRQASRQAGSTAACLQPPPSRQASQHQCLRLRHPLPLWRQPALPLPAVTLPPSLTPHAQWPGSAQQWATSGGSRCH